MATDSLEELSFRNAWSGLLGRIATGVGAAVALGAVLADVPVRIACLRGAATFLGILLVARYGLRLVLGSRRSAELKGPSTPEETT